MVMKESQHIGEKCTRASKTNGAKTIEFNKSRFQIYTKFSHQDHENQQEEHRRQSPGLEERKLCTVDQSK